MKDTNLIHSQQDGAVTGFRTDILVTTTDLIEGRRIVKALGLVRGNSVRSRHFGRELMAIGRFMIGGEIREYTKLLAEAREQALDRMLDQAAGLGANGVVSMRFTTSMVMGGAAELLAYGTAVVIE